MISILDRKKTFIDFIILIYLFILTILGFFFSFSQFFAFSGGIMIGAPSGSGFSVSQIANAASQSDKTGFNIQMGIIILLLLVLFLLNFFYYLQLRLPKKSIIQSILIIDSIIWILLVLLFLNLFSAATKAMDHNNLRVYGTGLFGILGLVSYLVLAIFELIWIITSWGKVFESESSGKQLQAIKPRGIRLLELYEIVGGILFAIFAIFFYILTGIATALGTGLSRIGGGNQTATNPYAPLAILMFAVAVLGIVTGMILRNKKYIGYILSWIYLILSGLVFIYGLIPVAISIIVIVYFLTNDNCKQYITSLSVG